MTTLIEALQKVKELYPSAYVQDNAHEAIDPEDEIRQLEASEADEDTTDYEVSDEGIFAVSEDGFVESIAVYSLVMPTVTSAEELIEILLDDSPDPTDTTKEELKQALQDGEYLSDLIRRHGPISQEIVEAAYELLSR